MTPDWTVYLTWLRLGRQLLTSNRGRLGRLFHLIVGALIAPEYRLEPDLEGQLVPVPAEHEGFPIQRKPKFY